MEKLRADCAPTSPPKSSAVTGFRVPRLPRVTVNLSDEIDKLRDFLEETIDQRLEGLKEAGLSAEKSKRPETGLTYRIKHGSRLVFFLRMRITEFGGQTVLAFLHGWNEPSSLDAMTAYVVVESSLDQSLPTVRITNFSLLDRTPINGPMPYSQLAEAIWEKACNVIESLVSRYN